MFHTQPVMFIFHFFFLKRAVEGLMEGLLMASIPGAPETPEQATRFRDCHLLVLKFLQDHRVYGPQWTNKQVTRWF